MDPDTNVDDLLNLDGIDDQTPPAPPDDGQEPPKDGEKKPTDQKPTDDVNNRVDKLAEDNKNLTETVRQLAEKNKTLSEFHDRLTGANATEDDKKKAQEFARLMEEDPIAATKQMIKEELSQVKDGLNLVGQTGVVDRAMRKINQKYVIDWDKDYPKIKEELAKFSEQSKKDDPEGTLLRAAQLARAVKTRKPEDTPAEFTPGRKGGAPPKNQKPENDINARLDKMGKRNKDNVFGTDKNANP